MTARETRQAIVVTEAAIVDGDKQRSQKQREYEAELVKPSTAHAPRERHDPHRCARLRQELADLDGVREALIDRLRTLHRQLPSNTGLGHAEAEVTQLMDEMRKGDVDSGEALERLATTIDQVESTARALAAARTRSRNIRLRVSALVEAYDLPIMVPPEPKPQQQSVRLVQLVAELLRQVIGSGAISPMLDAQLKKLRGADRPAVP